MNTIAFLHVNKVKNFIQKYTTYNKRDNEISLKFQKDIMADNL